MDSLNSLIGSLLSIISKRNIRYEGILHSIDCQNASIALRDVKSFGTENRVTLESEIVFPDEKVHSYVEFNGPDIADLQILKRPQQKVVSLLSVDPAVLTVQSTPPNYQQNNSIQIQQQAILQPIQQNQVQQQLQVLQQIPSQLIQQPIKLEQEGLKQSQKYDQQQLQQNQSEDSYEQNMRSQNSHEVQVHSKNRRKNQTNNKTYHNYNQSQDKFQPSKKTQYRKKEQNKKSKFQQSEPKEYNNTNQKQSEQIVAFPGSGNHLLKLREKSYQGSSEKIEANFDFETSLKDFEKMLSQFNLHRIGKNSFHTNENEDSNASTSNEATDNSNDKQNDSKKVIDSFFDAFSFDNQTADKKLVRNEKELNIETFGATGLANRYNFRKKRDKLNPNRNNLNNNNYEKTTQPRASNDIHTMAREHGRGKDRGGRKQYQKRLNQDDNHKPKGNNYRYRQINDKKEMNASNSS